MLQGTSYSGVNPYQMGYAPTSNAYSSGSSQLNTVAPFSSALSVPSQTSILPGAMPAGSPIQQMEMILSLLLQVVGTLISSQSSLPTNLFGNVPTRTSSPSQASSNYAPAASNKAFSSSSAGNIAGVEAQATPSSDIQAGNAGSTLPAPQTPPSQDAGASSSVSTGQPPNSLNVKNFGAKGDGSSDDQAALQKAIDQAKATGQSVWIPRGAYNHSGVLNIDGVKVSGAGDKTILHATNASKAAINLTGSNSALSNVELTSDSATRIPNAEASNVWINHADHAQVSGVTTVGSGANSVTVDASTHSIVDHVLGVGSNADGIAILNGSQHNTVQNSIVRQAGDDSFSDDSYTNDSTPTLDNQFLNNLSVDNRYGDNYKLAGATGDLLDHNVSIGGPKGGIVIIQDNDSGTRVSSGNVAQNNVAIDLTAPDVSAFMNPGGNNNNYYSKSDPAAQQYLAEAEKSNGNYGFNQDYVAGTGPGANNRNGNHLYAS